MVICASEPRIQRSIILVTRAVHARYLRRTAEESPIKVHERAPADDGRIVPKSIQGLKVVCENSERSSFVQTSASDDTSKSLLDCLLVIRLPNLV